MINIKRKVIYSFFSILISMPYFPAFLSAMACMAAIPTSCLLGLKRWQNRFRVLSVFPDRQ